MNSGKIMYEDEVRNELLAEIHNRLAEISKFLEVGIALLAKLSIDDLTKLNCECQKVNIETRENYTASANEYHISQDDNLGVGYDSRRGLHYEGSVNGYQGAYRPFGEDMTRSWPLDKFGVRFLSMSEIKAQSEQKKQKESE